MGEWALITGQHRMAALNNSTAALPEDRRVEKEVEYWDLGPGRRIAYRHTPGFRQPTILYIPGFFAPMTLRKTLRLEQYATENGYSNVRYDQECVGLSSGQQTTIEFEHWVEDALAMVDHVCQGPVVLVASSLGSWISVLVAQRRPERIHGMIFLGPGSIVCGRDIGTTTTCFRTRCELES